MDLSLDITTTMKHFISLATKHGLASQNGDSETANSLNDELIKIKERLAEQGELSKLIELLKHENESVQHYASVFLLHSNPAIALDQLRTLASGSSLVSLQAQTSIDLYSKGLI